MKNEQELLEKKKESFEIKTIQIEEQLQTNQDPMDPQAELFQQQPVTVLEVPIQKSDEQRTQEIVEEAETQLPLLVEQTEQIEQTDTVQVQREQREQIQERRFRITPVQVQRRVGEDEPNQAQAVPKRSFKQKVADHSHRKEVRKATGGRGNEVSYELLAGLKQYSQLRKNALDASGASPDVMDAGAYDLMQAFTKGYEVTKKGEPKNAADQGKQVDNARMREVLSRKAKGEAEAEPGEYHQLMESMVDEVLSMQFNRYEFSERNLRNNIGAIQEKANKLQAVLENPLMKDYIQNHLPEHKRNTLQRLSGLHRSYIQTTEEALRSRSVRYDGENSGYFTAKDEQIVQNAVGNITYTIGDYQEAQRFQGGIMIDHQTAQEDYDLKQELQSDLSVVSMVKQLKDRDQRKQISRSKFGEYESQGTDMKYRMLLSFLRGYNENEAGEPATEQDRLNKVHDEQFVETFYNGTEAEQLAQVKELVQELKDFVLPTAQQLGNKTFLTENAAQLKEISSRFTAMDDVLNKWEIGQKYQAQLSEEEQADFKRLLDVYAMLGPAMDTAFASYGVSQKEADYITKGQYDFAQVDRETRLGLYQEELDQKNQADAEKLAPIVADYKQKAQEEMKEIGPKFNSKDTTEKEYARDFLKLYTGQRTIRSFKPETVKPGSFSKQILAAQYAMTQHQNPLFATLSTSGVQLTKEQIQESSSRHKSIQSMNQNVEHLITLIEVLGMAAGRLAQLDPSTDKINGELTVNDVLKAKNTLKKDLAGAKMPEEKAAVMEAVAQKMVSLFKALVEAGAITEKEGKLMLPTGYDLTGGIDGNEAIASSAVRQKLLVMEKDEEGHIIEDSAVISLQSMNLFTTNLEEGTAKFAWGSGDDALAPLKAEFAFAKEAKADMEGFITAHPEIYAEKLDAENRMKHYPAMNRLAEKATSLRKRLSDTIDSPLFAALDEEMRKEIQEQFDFCNDVEMHTDLQGKVIDNYEESVSEVRKVSRKDIEESRLNFAQYHEKRQAERTQQAEKQAEEKRQMAEAERARAEKMARLKNK